MARLTVVGSSDAFNAAGRCHSCYLLEGDGAGPLMIDFGATALYALRKIGRSAADVRGFAFTHLHGDHVGGWPFLVIDGMFNAPRTSALDVVGPTGTARKLDGLMDIAYGDLSRHEKGFETVVREIAPGQEARVAGVSVRAFAAKHMDPPDEPLCLRATLPTGQVVAFSGDTAMCDGLFAAADGADLLVAECSCLAAPCGRHCTWEEWREALPRVGAKRVLLTHLGQKVRASVARLLADAPPGVDLAFADDGMIVTL